jgi:hypothetical protein
MSDQTRVSINESLHDSFLNSHVLLKREQELHHLRMDESWLDITGQTNKTLVNSHQLSSEFELAQSWWELAVKLKIKLGVVVAMLTTLKAFC